MLPTLPSSAALLLPSEEQSVPASEMPGGRWSPSQPRGRVKCSPKAKSQTFRQKLTIKPYGSSSNSDADASGFRSALRAFSYFPGP